MVWMRLDILPEGSLLGCWTLLLFELDGGRSLREEG